MKNARGLNRLALAGLLVVLTLSACVTDPEYYWSHTTLKDWDEMPEGFILLVGKFDFSPPFASRETALQESHFGLGPFFSDIAAGPPPQSEPDPDIRIDVRPRYDIEWGEHFFAVVKDRDQLYLQSPPIFRRRARSGRHEAHILGDLIIDVPEGARAVYIGTVLFEWDREFPVNYRFAIRDDFDEAHEEFTSRLGSSVPLLRADVRHFTLDEVDEYFQKLSESWERAEETP